MNHGYARCSTNESKQDIDRQVRELKQAGAERIFLEYEHGDAAVKCQLSSLLEQAEEGDTNLNVADTPQLPSLSTDAESTEGISLTTGASVVPGPSTGPAAGALPPVATGASLLPPQAHRDRHSTSAKSRDIVFFICVPSFCKFKKCVAPNGTTHRKTHSPIVATQSFDDPKGCQIRGCVFTKVKTHPLYRRKYVIVSQEHYNIITCKIQGKDENASFSFAFCVL